MAALACTLASAVCHARCHSGAASRRSGARQSSICIEPLRKPTAPGSRVYELRTYTAVEGRLDALHARFRDHILGFFQKHGMTNVVYFKPMDAPLSQTTLIYLLSHESRDAATRSWTAFRDYSPMK